MEKSVEEIKKSSVEIAASIGDKDVHTADAIKSLTIALASEENTNRDQERREYKIKTLLDVFTLIFIVFTTIGVFYQAHILDRTDKAIHDTLIASNRAWLTPISAQFFGNPKVGNGIGLIVRYGNTGKEPAVEFVAQEDIGLIDAPRNGASYYTVFAVANLKNICKRTEANEYGETIYPSATNNAYSYSYADAEFEITPEIERGTKLIFINGCFAYKTFGVEHKSEYCFILTPGIGGNLNPSFSRCPYGNRAH